MEISSVRGFLLLGLILIAGGQAGAAEGIPKLPSWLPPPINWEALNKDKIVLGRRLFYDRRLSLNGSTSCATCHRPELAFTDGRRVAVGATGEIHSKNTPSLANVAYWPVLTRADPNLRHLEKQLLRPLFGNAPVEMGMAGRRDSIVALISTDPLYKKLFADAFPGNAPNVELMAQAIAGFQRTLISADSPYDRFRTGDDNAISLQAKRGAALFFGERLQCFQCHGGLHFTDTLRYQGLPFDEIAFHNIGLYNLGGGGRYPSGNDGLADITGRAEDSGRFRTPSLRNVTVTAPYMHDGSVTTLREVIAIYAGGGRHVTAGPLVGDGRKHPHKSSLISGFTITPLEVEDLLEFLGTLTDKKFIANPAYTDPFDPASR